MVSCMKPVDSVKFTFVEELCEDYFDHCSLIQAPRTGDAERIGLFNYERVKAIRISRQNGFARSVELICKDGSSVSFSVGELTVNYYTRELSFVILKKEDNKKKSDSHPLESIFDDVLDQVTKGKGSERHGETEGGRGLTFSEQPIMTITRYVGNGYPLGQAMKKLSEVPALMKHKGRDAAYKEILGAIAYAAAAALYIKDES